MLHSSQQTSSDNNKHTLTSSNGLKIKLVKACQFSLFIKSGPLRSESFNTSYLTANLNY